MEQCRALSCATYCGAHGNEEGQSETGNCRNSNKTPQILTNPLTRRDPWNLPVNFTCTNKEKRALNKKERGKLPLPLYQHYLRKFSLSSHWLYPLKWQLPLIDELCGLFEISYLIALAVRCSAGQRMSSLRCFFFTHLPSQPKLLFTATSDLVCSLVTLLERSLWELFFHAHQ